MSATDYKAADDGAVTSASAPPMMVHVVAPSSLPEGYAFEANINNDPERKFTVEVVSIFGHQCLDLPSHTHPISFNVYYCFGNICSNTFSSLLVHRLYILLCIQPNSPLEA